MNKVKKQQFKSKLILKKQLLSEVLLGLFPYQLMMNKLKKQPFKEAICSEIGVFEVDSKTELLACKFLPQKRYQHLFKNNCIIHIFKITPTVIQK